MYLAIQSLRILRRDGGDASANAVRPEYNPSLNINATRLLESGCIPICIPICCRTFTCLDKPRSRAILAINPQSETAMLLTTNH